MGSPLPKWRRVDVEEAEPVQRRGARQLRQPAVGEKMKSSAPLAPAARQRPVAQLVSVGQQRWLGPRVPPDQQVEGLLAWLRARRAHLAPPASLA